MEWDFVDFCQDLQKCTSCTLGEMKVNKYDYNLNGKVLPYGDLNAKIMFVAQAPSFWRKSFQVFTIDECGLVFKEALKAAEWDRRDVYVTNLTKCSTRENIDAGDIEKNTCFGLWLKKEIKSVDPMILVPVGGIVAKFFGAQISTQSEWDHRVVFAINHPAAVLRKSVSQETLNMQMITLRNIHDSLLKNSLRTWL